MYSVYPLIFAVLCPGLLGALGMMIPRRAVSFRVWLAAAAPALTLVVLVRHVTTYGMDAGPAGVEWMPSLQLALSFQPDRLGLFFALLVAAVGLLIVLYARAYFGPDQNALYRLYPALLLFMTGMMGLVLADNFVLLLLFCELTSVSSFLLIGWERDDPAAVKNALQAFVVTGGGGIALLGGLILLGREGCFALLLAATSCFRRLAGEMSFTAWMSVRRQRHCGRSGLGGGGAAGAQAPSRRNRASAEGCDTGG